MNTCTTSRRSTRPAVLLERTNSDDLDQLAYLTLPQKAPARKSKKPSKGKSSRKLHSKNNKSSGATASTVSLDYSFEENAAAVIKSSSKKKSASSESSKKSSKSSSKKRSSRHATNAVISSAKETHLMFNNRNLEWMKDDDLTSTSVFHLHLNRPAIRIQAAARGMLQRVRYAHDIAQARAADADFERQVMRHEAAMDIQDAVRAWLSGMKQKVDSLTSRYASIQLHHYNELREIEENKKLEMERIYRELKHEMDSQEGRQDEEHVDNYATLAELKSDNKKLRKENKTLRKAINMMALKNKKEMDKLAQVEVDIEHMENVIIPRLEADSERGEQVCFEWLENIRQYEDALAVYNAKHNMEKNIGRAFHETVKQMAEHVQEECEDRELADSVQQLKV